jgi:hypothetical protein
MDLDGLLTMINFTITKVYILPIMVRYPVIFDASICKLQHAVTPQDIARFQYAYMLS